MPRGYPNNPRPRTTSAPVRRASNGKRITGTISNSDQYGAILWSLKHWGDINEGYKGGNATATLRKRMSEHGYDMTDKDFSNRMRYLADMKVIQVIREKPGGSAFNIRLVNAPATMPPDPFAAEINRTKLKSEHEAEVKVWKNGGPAEVVHVEHEHVTLNGYRKLTIPQRLALLDELNAASTQVNASIKEDLAQANVLLGAS